MSEMSGNTPAVNSFEELLSKMLDAWNERRSTQGLVDFLVDQLNAHGGDKTGTKSLAAVTEITRAIDEVEADYLGLREFRRAGGAREKWLEGKLGESLTQLPTEGSGPLLHAVCAELEGANRDLAARLFDAHPEPASAFDPIRADLRTAGLVLIPQLERNSELAVIAAGLVASEPMRTVRGGIHIVERCLTSPLGSPEELEVKKIAGTAAFAAGIWGSLPGLAEVTPAACGLLADRAISGLKSYAKVGAGDMGVPDALEYLIDRSAAAAATLVRRAARVVGEQVGSAIGQYVGQFFGPIGIAFCTKVGKAVGAWAGDKMGQCADRGIQYVAEKAKDLVRNGHGLLKSAVSWLLA